MYLRDMITALAEILNKDIFQMLHKINEQMLHHFGKTVAITLGRLGSIDPETCSNCLHTIIKPWCIALRYISGSEEKAQAFRGLCHMIPYNPLGIADGFPFFCEALVEFKDPPQDLEKLF